MQKSVLVLVEGNNDAHVLSHILAHHKIDNNIVHKKAREYDLGKINIQETSGIDGLIDCLRVELKPLDTDIKWKSISVIVDADASAEKRWVSIRTILQRSGYNTIPGVINAAGTIITEVDRPAIGVWVMPDNKSPGMLENFISSLIPSENNLWTLATQSVDSIPENERLFPLKHTIKAQVHTWLAWQEEPGNPFGVVIKKRILNPEAQSAIALVTWLKALANLD